MPFMHKDYIFLCPAPEEIEPLAHEDYLALLRAQKTLPQYAGRLVRIAIFYVSMNEDQPDKAVNANYGLLDFDGEGRASPHNGNSSRDENQAFWQAVEQSHYDDVDYDPQVQQLRRVMHDEFSWVPSTKEQRMMLKQIFGEAH